MATKTGDTLESVHQDHLSDTHLVSDGSGSLVNEIACYPYGSTRSGDVPIDKKFTGQRVDDIDLYYYGARYYDPLIGRFISADTVIQSFANPQTLKYVDPTGNVVEFENEWILHLFESGLDLLYVLDLKTKLQDLAISRSVWYALSKVAPDLTDYLTKADETVIIKWSGKVTYDGVERAEDGNIDMLIGHRRKGEDVEWRSCARLG